MIAKTKHDWLLRAVIIVVMILAILVMLPFISFMHYSYLYHQYNRSLTSSFVYGENKNTMNVSSENENFRLGKANAQRLYSVITQTGMGKPAKDGTEETGMLITFGDGAALEIRPAVITDKGRTNDTGVWLSYTDPSGKTFAYDTDKLQYENLRNTLDL